MSQKISPRKVDNDATKIEKRQNRVREKVFEGIDVNNIEESFENLSQCRGRHLKCLYDKWKDNGSVLLDRTEMFKQSTFHCTRGNTVFQAMSGVSHDVMMRHVALPRI